jgi:hypothetical protein
MGCAIPAIVPIVGAGVDAAAAAAAAEQGDEGEAGAGAGEGDTGEGGADGGDGGEGGVPMCNPLKGFVLNGLMYLGRNAAMIGGATAGAILAAPVLITGLGVIGLGAAGPVSGKFFPVNSLVDVASDIFVTLRRVNSRATEHRHGWRNPCNRPYCWRRSRCCCCCHGSRG